MLLRLFAVMLLTAPTLAHAQEAALYAPPPPEDAAYVRLIDLGNAAEISELGGTTLTPTAGAAGPYALVTEGEYELGEQKLNIAAGHAYSLIAAPTGNTLLEDPVADNPAKALIIFYNLTAAPALSLGTADGKTTIIEGAPAQGLKSRAVNGLTVSLAVKTADGALHAMPESELERGKAYSVIATGSADKPDVKLIENQVELPE